MKTKQFNIETAVAHIKKWLEAQHTLAKVQARNFGAQLATATQPLPLLHDNAEPFYAKIASSYIQQFTHVKIHLNGQIQVQQGSADYQEIDNHVKQYEKKLRDAMHKKQLAHDEQARLHLVEHPEQFTRNRYILYFLALFDVMSLATACMAFFRDYVLLAIIMGAAAGLGLVFLVKHSVLILRDSEDRKLKYFIEWCIFPLIFLAAIVFGILRYQGSLQSHGMQSSLSPLVFSVINLVVVATTAIVIYMHEPTKLASDQYMTWKKLDKHIKQLDKDITTYEKALHTCETNKYTIGQYRLQIRQAQLNFAELLKSNYQESVSEFQISNVRSRRDGVYPQAFKEKVAPLNLPTDDELFSHHTKNLGV